MAWFNRQKTNIQQQEQREMPDGLWTKCPSCNEIIYKSELEDNLFTCKKCSHHFRVGSKEYIEIIFDKDNFVETHQNIRSSDPLEFVDTKDYPSRIIDGHKKTNLNDAITIGYGNVGNNKISFGCMNFSFIGGSMGSVVGEKIYLAAKLALEEKIPFILISASGGARMQEAALSLMQMAKTSAILGELADNHVPYISILTDPTTGGVTASYAMLGDINIGEPGALIGFAGPRVIEQTIRRKLPPTFQRSEFLLEHGFLDKIIDRKNLREELVKIINWFKN